MIGYDPSEAQHLDLPDTYRKIPNLEKWTGADFIVSASTLPTKSEGLIAKHVATGAFLIQRKENGDLLSSMSDRMAESLIRMLEFGTRHNIVVRPAQRILLPIGVFLGKADDTLTVSGRESHDGTTWKQLQGSLMRWSERGGIVEFPLTNASQLTWYLEAKERHAIEIAANPIKEFIPVVPEMYECSSDPLQLPVKVRDGRRVLRTMMSERQANAVWNYCKHDLFQCFVQIFDPHFAKVKDKPEGIGRGFVDKCREIAGAKPGERLQKVVYDD